MSEPKNNATSLPEKISCSIEFKSNSLSRDESSEQVEVPTNDGGSTEQFRSVVQNFVTCLQVLWQYAHEIGTVAACTSLTHFAGLTSLLKEIQTRQGEALSHETPVAEIVVTMDNGDTGQQQETRIPVFEVDHAKRFTGFHTEHNKALRLLHETVLQQMVNAWERTLGDLVAWKLRADPDSIPSERTLTYSQLLSFGDLDEAQRHLIEGEVSEFLRSKTTLEQIRYFKKEFKADFQSLFPAVSELCELVLRRHAVVHAGGLASSEYCRRVAKIKNLPGEPVEQGALLPLDAKYIVRAWSVIYSAGVILTHLVACSDARGKKDKKNEEASDMFLNSAAVSAIKSKQHEAAKLILDYACDRRLANTGNDLMVLVNYAQACKWSGDEEKCKTILDMQEWNSCSANYRVCVAALREDETAFAHELAIVVQEKSISIEELFEWPAFQGMRGKESFVQIVRTVYGDDVKIPSQSARPKLLNFDPQPTISEIVKNIANDMVQLPSPSTGKEEPPTPT